MDDDEYVAACMADRVVRKQARKRGHTVPLSKALAKRCKAGSTILEMRALAKADASRPSNALHLEDVRQ